MVNDDLGCRMKEYERRNQYYLQKRTPVAIRVDMKSGHTFTKGLMRPFDDVLIKSMQETAKYMCENIQGTKISYVQSDEITIVLVDYDTLETDCWFNYRTDKLCSIAASMATLAFNRFFAENAKHWALVVGREKYEKEFSNIEIRNKYEETLNKAIEKGAMFDARCFNIPKEEVCNLIYWRQLDATRNSIQMVGQSYFSHKELEGKSCNEIQNMLLTLKGVNWNFYKDHYKRGAACIKEDVDLKIDDAYIKTISHWKIDKHMPILKGEERNYVEKLINFD